MILALLLACQADKSADSDTGRHGRPDTADTAAGADSGQVEADWPPLDPAADWTSTDWGYGTGLAWIDVDGDEDADLLVAYGNDMSPGPLMLYRNDGGVIETEASWQSANNHYFGHVSVGDVNGDGRPDVAASRYLGDARWDEPGGVQIYLNLGEDLDDEPAWEMSGAYTFSNALGDVDLDGDLDLMVAAGEGYYHDPEPSLLFVNNGSGDFGDAPVWASPDGFALDVSWADLDGDGWLDVAFARQDDGHVIYLNEGGTLPATPSWTASDGGFEGNTLAWGDVDGDGDLDLAVSDNDQLGGAGVVRLWCGPDWSLCWSSGDGADYQSALSLEDVDGDGDLDLVAGAWWGPVRVYNNADGQLDALPTWVSDEDDAVIEAFAWEDIDGSDWREATVTGERLVAVPGRALSVTGGVAQDGWASGPGTVSARYLEPRARDLAVSNWDPMAGNLIYSREDAR